MTIGEYQSLLQGYVLKQQDDMEELSILAMFTAKASGFDKNGKPLVTKPSDLFDKEKAIKQLKMKNQSSDPELKAKVEKFKKSKEYAEALLNGITVEGDDE